MKFEGAISIQRVGKQKVIREPRKPVGPRIPRIAELIALLLPTERGTLNVIRRVRRKITVLPALAPENYKLFAARGLNGYVGSKDF